jgi:multidrug resistance efflux pump
MKPSHLDVPAARPRLAWLVVSCLAIVLSSRLTAIAQDKGPPGSPGGGPSPSLQELVELAERQVDIKRASASVAEVHIAIANAKLKLLKAKFETARESERQALTKLERIKELYKSAVVSLQTVLEAEASVTSAAGLVREAEHRIAIGEASVELEAARRLVARAELAESETRLKQLQQRLKANK